MNNLSSKTHVINLLLKHNLKPKKRYGQNFLVDNFVIQKIITQAQITKNDLIIEIGPGLGVLTQELAKKAKNVCAIEIDTNFLSILSQNLADFKNIEIINADILKTDIRTILSRYTYTNAMAISNLPYYITTPIIFHILENNLPMSQLIFMIQKEVANRILAKPGTKDYGLLTLSLAYYAKAELIANVPANSFLPRPDVSSAVIKLTLNQNLTKSPKEKKAFFTITKAAFANRRKTLLNCLAFGLNISKQSSEELILSSGFSPTVRGEALCLEDFKKIACNYIKTMI